MTPSDGPEPTPVRLTEHVYVVGSGRLGLGVSHPLDCHVYLVDGGRESVLIDAGVGLDVDLLVAGIEACGAAPVTTVVLTHAHPDHAGGAAPLAARLGARLVASAETAAAVGTADEHRCGLDLGRRSGLYPGDLTLAPCDVAALDDGERLRVGELSLEVVATPGHSAGHSSFLLHRPGGRDLFSGDAMLFGGQIILQPTDDCEWVAQLDSLRRLAELRHDGLFPGHLGWSLRDGDAHARHAVDRLDTTGRPPIFNP